MYIIAGVIVGIIIIIMILSEKIVNKNFEIRSLEIDIKYHKNRLKIEEDFSKTLKCIMDDISNSIKAGGFKIEKIEEEQKPKYKLVKNNK